MYMGEEESFTITWQVKNFSMCPVEPANSIESPVIRIRQFGNSEWTLRLYPKGQNNEAGFVSCFLYCNNIGVCETINLKFNLSVVGLSSATRNSREHDYKLKSNLGWKKWISMEDILKEKDKFLPKDTLTIKCTMKCINICELKSTEEGMIDTLLRTSFSGKTAPYFNKCCCETIIPVQTKRFLQSIKEFLSLSENGRITLPLFSAIKETPSFYVTILKKSPIQIQINREKISEYTLFVKCTVSAVNASGGVKYSCEDEFLFTSDEEKEEVWNLSTSLDLSKLQEDGYFKKNRGVLYLQFDFAFSIEDQVYGIEKQIWDPFVPPSESQCPMEIFTASNIDDEYPVVTLRVVDRTYTVHKTLLKEKSPVFHAMFENDMKEKKTGVVDIRDVEPETLGQMLTFLYYGTVDVGLSSKEVTDLYVAADKYQIQSLIDCCSSTLMKSLKVYNVCDIMILADRYKNEPLLKCAEDFVVACTNPERLFTSQDWKDFMQTHLSVAANVMYKILMK